jgi:superfamily II DNA/RNA helicase
MKFILRRVPRDRQFLLFSATLNFEVLNTAYQFGAEPVEFNMSRDQITAEGIDHSILHVGQEEKPMYLLSLLKKHAPQQCIVFSNFKHNVARIAKFLKNNGIEAMEMSSLLSQAQRNRVFESFRSGKKQILVATDVAARGLDVKGIDLVVNFDLPDEAEGYVHRIGRTGRAGGSGRAIGMVSDRDVDALVRIETYLKEKVKIDWLEETELIKEFQPFPREFDRDERGPRPPTRGGGGRGARPQRPARPPRQHPPRPLRPHHDKNAQPPRHDKTDKVAHGQTADSPHNAAANEHRDRRLGRHGGLFGGEQKPQNAARPGAQQNNNNRHRHGQKNQPKQHANGSMPPRRQLKKDTNRIYKGGDKPASEAGIATKVKSFLTKIFK